MVYSSGSAVRGDISGPGTWAFLPAHLPDGNTVAINAGFVENTMQDRGVENRAVARLLTDEPVVLTGYLRFPEAAGALTPAEDTAKRLWFTRDHLAMARALGWGEGGKQVAPFYIDLEQPVPASGVPKPGPLEVHLKDDHLQYAVTLVRARNRGRDGVRGVAMGTTPRFIIPRLATPEHSATPRFALRVEPPRRWPDSQRRRQAFRRCP